VGSWFRVEACDLRGLGSGQLDWLERAIHSSRLGTYRGTSLIRNRPHPRNTIGLLWDPRARLFLMSEVCQLVNFGPQSCARMDPLPLLSELSKFKKSKARIRPQIQVHIFQPLEGEAVPLESVSSLQERYERKKTDQRGHVMPICIGIIQIANAYLLGLRYKCLFAGLAQQIGICLFAGRALQIDQLWRDRSWDKTPCKVTLGIQPRVR